MEEEDGILNLVKANKIDDIDEERETKPTREDVGNLLKDEEGKIYYLKITYNHGADTMKPEEYKMVEEHLYKKYYLYKTRSTTDSKGKKKPQTLSRSTYIAYLNYKQGNGGSCYCNHC